MRQPVTVDIDQFRPLVDVAIREVLERGREQLADLTPESEDLVEGIQALCGRGKRLRPSFFWWGWRCFSTAEPSALAHIGAALELFHSAALLHDDVMDRSDTRRGTPTLHRHLSTLFARRRMTGDAEQFGAAGAILAGDLCLAWSEHALRRGLLELTATGTVTETAVTTMTSDFAAMQTQLMAGQYLDMTAQARGLHANTVAGALRVIEHKTARYSVVFPLIMGATLAGAQGPDRSALSLYGLALGTAFQLRDDELGVFGDPQTTGKPAGDDLREGKQTVLLALARSHCDATALEFLGQVVGNADVTDEQIATARTILTDSGCLQRMEDMIITYADTARRALDDLDIHPAARTALVELVRIATERAH